MKMIFCVYDRSELLSYFLRYYQRMGITHFFCGVHNGTDNPLYGQIERLATEYPLEVFESFRDAPAGLSIGDAEIAALRKIRTGWNPEEWHAIADLDEFVHFPKALDYSQMSKRADASGYNAIQGTLYDRIAPDGRFPSVGPILDDTYPYRCDLTKCIGGNNSKIVLLKSHVEVLPGHHQCLGNALEGIAHVHHFKWINGVAERMLKRHRWYVESGISWAYESANLLKSLDESGRIPLTLPDLNVIIAERIGI
jgi:hypothetical protein